MSEKRFVKAASTSVPVSRSQAHMEDVLRRYGCSGFGFSNDYETGRVSVHFMVADTPEKNAVKIPVRLEVNTRLVYDALFGRPTHWDHDLHKTVYNPAGYVPADLQQAERVAWRQMLLWVDAACSAASAGVQKMSEAFFAHTLIRDEATGGVRRLVDIANSLGGGDWKALLPPPGSEAEAKR